MARDTLLPLDERLARLLERLAHVLPGQGPIGQFVHHNTLHGFQHLPFAEALAAAQRLTGAEPYLPEAAFRAFYKAGRITEDDLAAAFDEAGLADLDQPVLAGVSRRRLLQAALTNDDPQTPAALDWRLAEHGVDNPALWQACREVAQPVGSPPRTGDAPTAGQAKEEPGWHGEAAAWAEELLGQPWTLRELLRHLTGEDVLDALLPGLRRHLAAHLDSGIAAWRHPAEQQGFFAAWRQSACLDRAFDLAELPHARDQIAQLAADPLAVLAEELPRLAADETRWPGYLERLALELPGWSGMVLWRQRNAAQGDKAPVCLVDYLAVRVVLERLYTEDLLRRWSGVPLAAEDLAGHLAQRPAEFYVRHALSREALPEDLRHAACGLTQGGEGSGWKNTGEAAWEALAERIARWRKASGQPGGGADEDFAWPLYRLLQPLAVEPAAVRAAGREGCQRWLHAAQLPPLQRRHLWLLAYERHYRQEIFAALAHQHRDRAAGEAPGQPSAQLIFCMDDREEGVRRHLEEIAPAVETYGAAGFFGIALYWRGIDDPADAALCPVAIRPVHRIEEEPEDPALAAARAQRRGWRLKGWKSFVQGGARASAAALPLVLAGGTAALAALAAGSAWPRPWAEMLARWRQKFDGGLITRLPVTAEAALPAPSPEAPQAGFTDREQVERVADFLSTIGLTGHFAPLVALVGHGSHSRNNPHLSAYDCGACSGRHGGPNARVFAAMANRPAVRRGLAGLGIAIPEDTWFVAAEHDTCDDGMHWYDAALVPAALAPAFDRLAAQMDEACRRHAAERCRRFASAPKAPAPEAGKRHVEGRRGDFSQPRPELGHVANAAAFVGRRAMSRGLFLDRRVFLISYDPLPDPDGAILENLLLSVGPVGAGISLEYYFSTVDNEYFGCGSKVTHNLAGLLGVMEGAASDLRTGLPRQMIEIHEAMRLLLVIEQRPAVIAAVIARQAALRQLADNEWIIVAARDPDDAKLYRYRPGGKWLPWTGPEADLPRVDCSAQWTAGRPDALPPAAVRPAKRETP